MLKRFHTKLKRPMIVIQPGEYYVTDEDVVIATVLGSCISVCLKDEANGIGGMNHFMLPGDFRSTTILKSQSARYGMYAMELVIGDIIKMGGDRNSLTAKFFGGGHVLASLPATENAVPKANIEFINSFLSMEGIKVLTSDVGGNHGRKLLYLPALGKAYVKRLVPGGDDQVAEIERRYKRSLKRESQEEEVTLF
jgi:chemotaxis protein CheD